QQKIDGMEEEISKVRERLVEASREKKVVDKLRERKLREYQYELNREAAKETDDANQKLYVRRLIENAG
ncbi:MAG TPA: flagellar FliJ family protein, partial [Spirochaetota bacterium]|nr:flagellar FliJ family protein [Spirochaetota bacterium]